MEINKLQSKVINSLRFPLIIGVIFIHNYNPTAIVQGIEIGSNGDMPIYYVCSNLFSQLIGRIAVPLFFFISGFLFFLNVDFRKNAYKTKVYSRIFTLLIPYLFWNIAFLIFHYIASHLPGLSVWFKEATYTLDYFLSALWGQVNDEKNMTFPIAYQFWFIRDLMLVVLMTPLIYYFLKKFKIYGLTFVGLLWFWDFSIPYIGIRGLSTSACFFFMIGAWFSINHKNVIEEFRKVGNWIYLLYIVAAITYLCTINDVNSKYIQSLSVLFGIVCCFKIAEKLVDKSCFKVVPFLSSASFFVFAVHEPWLLSQIKKMLYKLLQPQSDIMLTFLYFGIVALVVVIALISYYVLKRIFPRFTAVITGGR